MTDKKPIRNLFDPFRVNVPPRPFDPFRDDVPEGEIPNLDPGKLRVAVNIWDDAGLLGPTERTRLHRIIEVNEDRRT